MSSHLGAGGAVGVLLARAHGVVQGPVGHGRPPRVLVVQVLGHNLDVGGLLHLGDNRATRVSSLPSDLNSNKFLSAPQTALVHFRQNPIKTLEK